MENEKWISVTDGCFRGLPQNGTFMLSQEDSETITKALKIIRKMPCLECDKQPCECSPENNVKII
jgi:hypothetical protein